eukprot:11190355-Lingulodinium_polyedra.AAC.1
MVCRTRTAIRLPRADCHAKELVLPCSALPRTRADSLYEDQKGDEVPTMPSTTPSTKTRNRLGN